MRNIYVVLSLAFLFSCQSNSEKEITTEESDTLIVDDTESPIEFDTTSLPVYTWETYYAEDLGWGYKIFMDGNNYINQPHIPAISGVKGFNSENQAATTAKFAIYKLNQGIVPPTISQEELDSLGVLD